MSGNARMALDAYEKLVARLERQIDKLEKELAEAKSENEILRTENAGLKASKNLWTPLINPKYPYPEGPYIYPPDKESKPAAPPYWKRGSTAPTLPDSFGKPLPDSIGRPWYDNPNYRLNENDGPYAGDFTVTCDSKTRPYKCFSTCRKEASDV